MFARRGRPVYCMSTVRPPRWLLCQERGSDHGAVGTPQVLVDARRSPAGLGRPPGLWAWDIGAPSRDAHPATSLPEWL